MSMRHYGELAAELEPMRGAWLECVPADIRPLVRRFHLPLLHRVMADMGYEDSSLMERIMSGFLHVGELDPLAVG